MHDAVPMSGEFTKKQLMFREIMASQGAVFTEDTIIQYTVHGTRIIYDQHGNFIKHDIFPIDDHRCKQRIREIIQEQLTNLEMPDVPLISGI